MLIVLEVKIKLPVIVFFILYEGMFEKFAIMAPCQFVRQCLTIWVFDVQLSHPMKIRTREPLSEILCQTLGEFLQDLLAIFRTTSAILFVLHYQAPTFQYVRSNVVLTCVTTCLRADCISSAICV